MKKIREKGIFHVYIWRKKGYNVSLRYDFIMGREAHSGERQFFEAVGQAGGTGPIQA
ncbi:MAG: hypothetical protein LUE63_03290 [Lachnospiraceae bacterium]|nr:hypothetical protein [Lachnospiraceae bacterium]